MKKDKSISNKILIAVIGVVLLLYTLTILTPIVWGLITSLKSNTDFLLAENVLGFPDKKLSEQALFELSNYTYILADFEIQVSANYISGGDTIYYSYNYGFLMLLWFTLLYAGGGCIISTFVPCIMAYVCAKYRYKLSKLIYMVAILIMIIPIIGSFPAEITLLRRLNLYDSLFGNYIQKFNFTGMYFFVFYAFFEGLADSYSEAAEIDGASQANILFRIVLPLAGKMISSVMLIMFITYWDDYQTPLLYLPTWPTIAYSIYEITRDSGASGVNSVPGQIAGCMLLALPILIMFIVLKDKLMGNLSMGGLKE